LAEILKLTLWDDVSAAADELVELCASAGVAVVFVGEIGKTRASGAARWLTPTKALIQLSLRHKTDDHLWFSFFHEAAHILLHSKEATFITGTDGEANETMEGEAKRFAANQLIPRHLQPELARLNTEADVRAFAPSHRHCTRNRRRTSSERGAVAVEPRQQAEATTRIGRS
jgi:uncharacterized protein DUF955